MTLPRHSPEYHKNYSRYKSLILYSTPLLSSLIEDIKSHPLYHCIHLPAMYGVLYSLHKGKGKRNRYQILKHKEDALRDVLSYLDSLTFGVIR